MHLQEHKMFDRLEDILIAAKENIFKSKIKKALFFVAVLYLLISGCNKVMQYAGCEIIGEYPSPNGQYIVTLYFDGGGIFMDTKVYGRVHMKHLTFLSREIYWARQFGGWEIEWLNNYTVEIDGQKIPIILGKFDSRNHPEMYE